MAQFDQRGLTPALADTLHSLGEIGKAAISCNGILVMYRKEE